ncbi:antitoxin [Streptomyces apocyni]|uniref:antitoxin n=1 Tax=Streptomyces apocyni TaxID=2654677 RepID=UPI0012EA621A|nr:antitoxin [Streptomyces apocyni]
MFDNLKNLKGLKDKASELAAEHGETVGKGLDKAADIVDSKTGGKHSDKIDTGVEKAKGLIDGLGDKK